MVHESLKEVYKNIGVKKAGQRIARWGKLAWRKSDRELFLSSKGLQAALNKRSAVWVSLLEALNAKIHKTLRICEDRPVQIEESEASYVSLDRVDGPWPS